MARLRYEQKNLGPLVETAREITTFTFEGDRPDCYLINRLKVTKEANIPETNLWGL